MAKTRPTGESVTDFIASIANARRRADTSTAVEMFRSVTGARPEMWGPSIIGFGRNPYTTADGAEHDWFTVGLSPRRQALTLYGISEAAHADLLDRLGPHTTGKGCLYVKNLADVDEEVLRRLVEISWRENDDAATTT
ncbi:DUF1801 domain-containing protein [Gordonia sp. X0973]|nr:DUF1801 domain-containing protein [Gordonia sp. X0973]